MTDAPVYHSGDVAGYRAASEAMRRSLEALSGRVLVAHHGDCDGIVGGGLLARFLSDRGVDVRYASAAEFRAADLPYFEQAAIDCDAAVFVEAQGMPPEYAALDAKFLNIDHHPHPPDTPIRRMLNPRGHGLEPNPAIALVMWELLRDALPPEASWLAALGSIVDYCPDAARSLIDAHKVELARLDGLRDTFLASQYLLPFTTDLAAVIARIPTPDELLAAEPFASRRLRFASLMSEAMEKATRTDRLMIARTTPGEFRIASPLANRLQDVYTDLCIVVIEQGDGVSRISVRNRKGAMHVGRTLSAVTGRLGEGDGTGHERAGSARIPRMLEERFLKELEAEVG